MSRGKVWIYLLCTIALCGVLVGAHSLDKALSLYSVFVFVAQAAGIVACLTWLTWFGERPERKPHLLKYGILGIVPVLLHGVACFTVLDGGVEAVNYIWAAIKCVSFSLLLTLFCFGVGSTLLAKNGRLTLVGRILMILSFALPSLTEIARHPGRAAEYVLATMVALAMGAFLSRVYENGGKLWAVMLLHSTYLFVEEFFRVGGKKMVDQPWTPTLGGTVYYVIFIVNIVLYTAGAFLFTVLEKKEVQGKRKKRPHPSQKA